MAFETDSLVLLKECFSLIVPFEGIRDENEDRSSFYRWHDGYQKRGEFGLKNTKSIPKNPANQTPAKIVEKVLNLRRKYHLGPIRIA